MRPVREFRDIDKSKVFLCIIIIIHTLNGVRIDSFVKFLVKFVVVNFLRNETTFKRMRGVESVLTTQVY